MELLRPVVVQCYGLWSICPVWACPWAKNLPNLLSLCSRLHKIHISETAGRNYVDLYIVVLHYDHFDGLVQERCNSSVLGMELHLSCTNPSICLFSPYGLAHGPNTWVEHISSLKVLHHLPPNQFNLNLLNVYLCSVVILATWAH